jgi:hypothetical protein
MNYLPITVSNHLLESAGTTSTAQGVVLLGYGILVALVAVLWTVGRYTLGSRQQRPKRHYPRLSRPTQAPAGC